MEKVKFKEIFKFQKKTSLKASDGNIEGEFPFYTSSVNINKWTDKPIYEKGSLVIGNGGRPNIHFADKPFSATSHCYIAVARNEKINTKFTYYFLSSNLHLLERGFIGAGLKNISKKYIEQIPIPLPDLETQNKIVALLDKAKAIVDKREATIQKYDELLRAVFLEMFGDPVLNPKGWPIVKLKELGKWKSGGTPSRAIQDYFEGKVPWVTSGELNNLYITDTKEYISEDAINNSNAKLIPENSLLIGMYDTAALKSSINTILLACNQAIAYSQIDEKICGILYVHSVIQIGKDYYKSIQRGVRQQNLNLSMIGNLAIPKPPLFLQHKFEDKYKYLLSINNKVKQAKEQSEYLLKSLSQQAFSNKITIDLDTALEALINAVDLKKKDKDNKIDTITNDLTYLQRLMDRLEGQEFEDANQYDKAKYILFKIMNKEKDLVKQVWHDGKIKLTLQNETT